MIKNFEVKIVRLKNGEDIIAFVYVDTDNKIIHIKNPKSFYFNFDSDTQEEELIIVDWLNINAFSTQEVKFSSEEILFIQYPTIKFGYEYLNLIQEEIAPDSDLARKIKDTLNDLNEQETQTLH